MSRIVQLQTRLTPDTDRILAAAGQDGYADRTAVVGNLVSALGEIGMTALAEAMTADSDAETDTLGSAMAWARARGLADAVEILARHIAPDTEQEPARA